MSVPIALFEPGKEKLRASLKLLSQLPSGRALLVDAEKRWAQRPTRQAMHIEDLFKWGAVSRTDAVLTRHFNPATGQEQQERNVTVYLKEDQTLDELALDIAHELTHAIARPAWDPYDPNLTAGRYIMNAIEGDGGEVDAIISECRVGLEMVQNMGVNVPRCLRYKTTNKDGTVTVQVNQVQKDFYRVGKWYRPLLKQLGSEARKFPLINDDEPQLYSSTGYAPYPVALYREFEELTRIACDNSRRRLTNLAVSLDRSPASSFAARERVDTFIKQRCNRMPEPLDPLFSGF